MSEGRKTRRAGPKDEKAKLDRDWQKISQVRIFCIKINIHCVLAMFSVNPKTVNTRIISIWNVLYILSHRFCCVENAN